MNRINILTLHLLIFFLSVLTFIILAFWSIYMAYIPTLFGLLAGLLTMVAYGPYLLSTIKGKTKPNRATWWILVVVGVMLASSYYALGAHSTLWVPLSYIIGPLVIASLSIKFGEGGLSKLDIICLIGAFSGFILWWIFANPLIALIINLIIDFLGLIPTIKKSYLRPHTEDEISWVLWFAGSFLNLMAMDIWSVSLFIYPIYMVIGNGLIALLVCQKYIRINYLKIKK